MRVTHCISGLGLGGAEMALFRLAVATRHHDPLVVSLISDGPLESRLREAGIRVRTLDKRAGLPDPRVVPRLARLLRREQPEVLQTWMYEANLYGLAAGRMAGVPGIVWNLRCADTDWRFYPRTAALAFRLNKLLARHPDAIVVNSWRGRAYHRQHGFETRRMRVIPNGFDTVEFRPDPEARQSVRAQFGVGNVPLVGLIGRHDPQKDHATFARAAAAVTRALPDTRFLLAGSEITLKNAPLVALFAPEVRERSLLLGRRDDIARLMRGLDVLVMSSASGEGFPNVLGEAMSSGVPCVATDLGDAARIVGQTGKVVPPGDHEALARAVVDLLSLGHEGRQRLGRAARKRIQQHFSHQAARRRYEDLYGALAGRREPIPCPA